MTVYKDPSGCWSEWGLALEAVAMVSQVGGSEHPTVILLKTECRCHSFLRCDTRPSGSASGHLAYLPCKHPPPHVSELQTESAHSQRQKLRQIWGQSVTESCCFSVKNSSGLPDSALCAQRCLSSGPAGAALPANVQVYGVGSLAAA